ncbi:hypothetical protein BK816_07415 [Boudabousia tangfeifanii]|uniref:DNA-binding response regulator n=1 Tax=Boudabousia tangfeifanii TaxID=1912795 RepID=A0A1D9MLS8_9ACTO|nr:response regulator transcription factor [Boudabousia tangfeifanii]AOZ73139.1 hypothetical protein BK816_07415 [Boudabousia tangfeifanii]
MKVLVIEDDKGIQNFLNLALLNAGYQVVFQETALSGIEAYYRENPDIILLDLGLADLDGTEVISQIRLAGNTPIVVISARQTDEDKVSALDQGANDYLTKPFSIAELLARMRVALRTVSATPNAPTDVFEGDTFTVDFAAHRVMVGGVEVHLTKREFALLQMLTQHVDQVLTHQLLQETVWGYADDATAVSLRVYVRALRQKLQTQLIQTEVGVGYRLLSLKR